MILQKIINKSVFNKWVKTDPELSRLREANFFWEWPIYKKLINDLETSFKKKKSGIYIVRGPRQVGKSSLIKKVSKVLFESSTISNLFFLRGDLISDYKELYSLIKNCLTDMTEEDLALFSIDEVTFISEWQRAIKALVDERACPKCSFLITGSNASDLRSAIELFPGRRGEGKDYVLLPMDFLDFTKYSSIDKPLKELFTLYLKLGGFPHSLNEYLANNQNEEAKNIYLSWIRGDILKAKKNDVLLRELFAAIFITGSAPVSFDALKKKTSFGSHNTVHEYLTFLEGAFVINQVQKINPGIWTFNPKKNRKIYFRDPLIYNLGHEWPMVKTDEKDLGYLYETLVAEKLKRMNLKFGYFRGKDEKELDFYSENYAIEVKTTNKVVSGDFSTLLNVKSSNKFLIYSGPSGVGPKKINLVSIWDFLSDFMKF